MFLFNTIVLIGTFITLNSPIEARQDIFFYKQNKHLKIDLLEFPNVIPSSEPWWDGQLQMNKNDTVKNLVHDIRKEIGINVKELRRELGKKIYPGQENAKLGELFKNDGGWRPVGIQIVPTEGSDGPKKFLGLIKKPYKSFSLAQGWTHFDIYEIPKDTEPYLVGRTSHYSTSKVKDIVNKIEKELLNGSKTVRELWKQGESKPVYPNRENESILKIFGLKEVNFLRLVRGEKKAGAKTEAPKSSETPKPSGTPKQSEETKASAKATETTKASQTPAKKA